jgi:hypothetical protein
MARLEAEVSANIGPFERALRQAGAEAREFAAKTADIGKDIFKEAAGSKLTNLLGLAGAGAAATAFGSAVIETAKSSLEAFGHLEKQVLQLKYNLKDPTVAKEIHEWLEQLAQNDEEVDKLHSAFVSLSESGLNLEKSKEVLQDLQAVALKSGESVESLAEAFRRAKAGGLDAGEGAAKLLKALPGLSTEIEKQIALQARAAETGVTPYDPVRATGGLPVKVDKGRAAELRRMSAADFVKSGLLDTSTLERMLHRMAPRQMVAESRETLEGTAGRLGIVIDNLKESFGEGLAPAIKQLTKDLSDNLPKIEESLKAFGEALGKIVSIPHVIAENRGEIAKVFTSPGFNIPQLITEIINSQFHKPSAPTKEGAADDLQRSTDKGNELLEKLNGLLESLLRF